MYLLTFVNKYIKNYYIFYKIQSIINYIMTLIFNSINEFNIYSYTGKSINKTIKILPIKNKRYITARILPITIYNNKQNINSIKYSYLIIILNRKAKIINKYFRNYYIRKLNKLTKIYKKLYFIQIYKNNNSLCLDVIEKILNHKKLTT